MKNNQKKQTQNRKKSILTIQEQTIKAIEEIARLFPGQDPIRLSSGVIDFKLPMNKTLAILRRLAPLFKNEQADMIRIQAGFRDLYNKILSDNLKKQSENHNPVQPLSSLG